MDLPEQDEMERSLATQLTGLDDNILIRRALGGETECFNTLMDRHLAAVRRCVGFWVRSEADSEDLIQDVVLKVWRFLSTFRLESSFKTWITRIAINEVLQSYRRNRRTLFLHQYSDFESLVSSEESPYRSLDRIEVVRAVRRAVTSLPRAYRSVLTLRDLDELSCSETAQRLQLSNSAVKTRLFRARQMLSLMLRDTRSPAMNGTFVAQTSPRHTSPSGPRVAAATNLR